MDDDRYCHIHPRLRRSRLVIHQSAWKETACRKTPLRSFRALFRDSKTRHRSVLDLMCKCLDAVLDYRLVLQRPFNRLENSQKAISSKLHSPGPPNRPGSSYQTPLLDRGYRHIVVVNRHAPCSIQ
jgi:hypothetical protein